MTVGNVNTRAMADRRRMSLATVSTSVLNTRASTGAPSSVGIAAKAARQSMGPARVASSSSRPSTAVEITARAGAGAGAAVAAPVPHARQSYGGVPRSSSIGGRNSKEDPRNIKSGAFLHDGSNCLLGFLMENHYDHDISLKQLKAPSAFDFEKMTTFIVRQLDPTFKIEKMTHDIPDLFKHLRCVPARVRGAAPRHCACAVDSWQCYIERACCRPTACLLFSRRARRDDASPLSRGVHLPPQVPVSPEQDGARRSGHAAELAAVPRCPHLAHRARAGVSEFGCFASSVACVTSA
jgi:hypothetical protein